MKTSCSSLHGKKLPALLIVASIACISLLIVRAVITSHLHFWFLGWNLFLAWIPFVVAILLKRATAQHAAGWKTGLLFFCWLLFFPNAPYILTDLFHLRERAPVPLWFDLALIASFAWNGLMLGFISLLEVQDFLRSKFSASFSWITVSFLLFLCGFGIYLGRYVRWNSWDLFTNPLELMKDTAQRFFHPFEHPRTMGVTLLFWSFLMINYSILAFLRSNNQSIENKSK